ncbi:probable E3 ubiquitin-protein ligase RNF144A-A [Varroa jacobsoni]|uniref:RBR-type E3 ubiquitin transferase n=1 Tax=Varroa destructor TaxID=109461 RepID=A0A7M7KQD4_VARDE|nr:probable E3 ubiquitin-protein ligase RNF144A-A [Varroa destructor]XP_022670381.1 probable E3 ubiquitin-protein ligase RNF144A-A [Varroa destructor]XP_022670382.1 probable E3 ubiquitin-protein ligase RNF144A-A [Varroa destructor]XP_022670383.1 probable E3 ubiquitin-protein ligase RNF144A-A [Varroa destructor]XP_022699853.1 probable E3 ubiquitin-protein ligase RNF144A-A [Varroa jacobsoni]
MSQSGPVAHQWADEDTKSGWNCLPFSWLFQSPSGKQKLARVLPKSQTFVSVARKEVRLHEPVARSLSANDVPTSDAAVANLCQLCLCVVSLKRCMRLEPCAHSFCVECLEQHAVVCVQNGRASVPCPHTNCDMDLREPQARLLLKNQPRLLERWQTLLLNEQITRDPLRMFCPGPSCENVCDLPKPTVDPYGLQCSKCRYTFCVVCQDAWHPLKDCDQATILHNLLQDIQGIKRCPHCSVLIEREDGCAQMLCKNCRHVFCWFCLASLDDDFLLRHYDHGPCRHKLGHSRASVMWHRTQVLGIFAGFGFLVLLASPLLILAVPCILGGKCGARCATCATSGQGDADDTANKPPPPPAAL